MHFKILTTSLLFLFGTQTAFALTCQQKFEAAIKEISEMREVRFANLPPSQVRYYEYILDTPLGLKRSVPFNKETQYQKIAKFYDNQNPNDIKYLVESNKKIKPSFSGGEADIYVNPKNKNEALKVWKEARTEDFELSTKTTLLLEEKVSKNPKVSQYLKVSQIKERGPNYIVKEFFPNTVEISKVSHDKKFQNAYKKLTQSFLSSSNVLDKKIYNALIKKSANFHWDAKSGKIILIDALGF